MAVNLVIMTLPKNSSTPFDTSTFYHLRAEDLELLGTKGIESSPATMVTPHNDIQFVLYFKLICVN